MNIKDLIKILEKYKKKDQNTQIRLQTKEGEFCFPLEKDNISFEENDGFMWGQSFLTFTVNPKKDKDHGVSN